jgi:predicted nucleic acid-binding protein
VARRRPLIYWDSCIFIAWLNNEQRPGNEMQGVSICLEAIQADEIIMMTSAMMKAEVLPGKIPPDVRSTFERFLCRRNVVLVDVDLRIGELSGELRDFYVKQAKVDGEAPVEAADAVHLATAIHYGADAFYTFDEGGEGARRSRSLLSLNGNVGGHQLVVCKPPVKGQLRLDWR